MATGQPSDEVAEDYDLTLKDLTTNDRYSISNLTIIAKENTEHALAISRVLENHIGQARPDHKLPALYVLDSVVKNVGTPYTLFLGRNLYHTFINAYSLVPNPVRKKLNEMLETWKAPVPGSIEKRPVFPPDVTRPIETALIKARTIVLQSQQSQARSQQELLGRGRPLSTPLRSWPQTPTPPQITARYPPPVSQGYPQRSVLNGQPQILNGHTQNQPPYAVYPQQATPLQLTQPVYQQPSQQPSVQTIYPLPYTGLDSLHNDIESLIVTARTEFAANPYDTGIQTRLKALLDLQSILRSQQLPSDQIQQIRDQVASLSATPQQSSLAPAPAPTPSFTYNPPVTAPPTVQFQAPQMHPQPQSLPQPPISDLQALLTPNSLANLLASAAKVQQAPPKPSNATAHLQPPHIISQPPSSIPSTITAGGSSLIASLRAAGMILPAGSNQPTTVPVPAQMSLPYQPPPPIVPTPLAHITSITRPNLPQSRNNVELTSASLKTPRPHLISKIYEVRSNQCSTCGRRFFATEEGRSKKARHLDWHFRTNQRLVDSAKKGQSRSWYVDEMEWIKSRDNEDEGLDTSANGGRDSKTLAAAAAAAVKNDPKTKFIPVPSDHNLANAPCPICQERFETSWNDEMQDFVWMDAIKIGTKVYHASCHAEIKKDGGNTPLRTSTPDSVLGKRKAEVAGMSLSSLEAKKEIRV